MSSSRVPQAPPLGKRPKAYTYPGGRVICASCVPLSQFATASPSLTWYVWPPGRSCSRCKRGGQ